MLAAATAKNTYEQDECEIISAAQADDNESIEYLLKKYKRIVLACVRNYYLQGAEKDDLIQEGMLALYYAIKGHNFKHPFPAFAKTCIYRRMCTAVRLYSGQNHKVLSNAVNLDSPIYNDGNRTSYAKVPEKRANDPYDTYIQTAEKNEILDQVQRILSEYEKQVLTLYVDGLSYKDIARTMGKREKSVDNALQRARKKLRSAFCDKGNN